jgi:hypothetical protein
VLRCMGGGEGQELRLQIFLKRFWAHCGISHSIRGARVPRRSVRAIEYPYARSHFADIRDAKKQPEESRAVFHHTLTATSLTVLELRHRFELVLRSTEDSMIGIVILRAATGVGSRCRIALHRLVRKLQV